MFAVKNRKVEFKSNGGSYWSFFEEYIEYHTNEEGVYKKKTKK